MEKKDQKELKLNGNTINMFDSFMEWERLRQQYPRHSERLFITQILGIATSVFYRKRAKVMAKMELFPLYLEHKKQQHIAELSK